MTNPQFEPPVEPKRVSSTQTTALVLMGLLFIAGVCVLIFVLVVQKTATTIAPGIREGWRDITAIRQRDAALTTAQKEAGAAYLPNLVLDLKARPIRLTGAGYQAELVGTVSNKGDREVLSAVAAVTFPAAEGDAPADTRRLILFDATPLSPRPDRPLSAGETRDVSILVESINTRWDSRFLSARVDEARLDLDGVVLESTAAELDSTAPAARQQQ